MKVCLFRTTFYWPIRVQLETYSSHYNFHPFSLWKIITLQRIIVFCMWKAYHFDRWSLNYITLIHCRGTICPYETLLYSAIFWVIVKISCLNIIIQDSWNISSNAYAPIFFFLLFFIQKISFLFSFLITFFLYSTHAGPNSGDISVIKADNHQAATVQTLGNPFKLVHKQKIPDVREKSLRFRPDDSFNPCLKSARLVLIDRLIVVKVLTCRKTTNLGCKPAEGRCRPNYSLVRSPGGTELVYTSKCVCATTWLKSHCI